MSCIYIGNIAFAANTAKTIATISNVGILIAYVSWGTGAYVYIVSGTNTAGVAVPIYEDSSKDISFSISNGVISATSKTTGNPRVALFDIGCSKSV